MTAAITITNLSKTYDNGFAALQPLDLTINKGEIFALLGPNGAGKTTLISAICGLVQPTTGTVNVCGYDHTQDYRAARAEIGLVPQELTTSMFEKVWNNVNFSRALFGKPKNHAYIEDLLKKLSLWDKKDNQIRHLSGGMKRRVLIAKALAHEPKILFLDEPTAGVDVDLRKSMWQQVAALKETGVTIILTTHYIEEAEDMADRIGVINKGQLILVEEKQSLMQKMLDKQLVVQMAAPLAALPAALAAYDLSLEAGGHDLVYNYDSSQKDHNMEHFLTAIKAAGIQIKDFAVRQNRLEDIFVQLVGQAA